MSRARQQAVLVTNFGYSSANTQTEPPSGTERTPLTARWIVFCATAFSSTFKRNPTN
jgi:hypothetical protein